MLPYLVVRNACHPQGMVRSRMAGSLALPSTTRLKIKRGLANIRAFLVYILQCTPMVHAPVHVGPGKKSAHPRLHSADGTGSPAR